MPGVVRLLSVGSRATPKSVSTQRPSAQMSTLAGFTSRCSTPAACATSSAPSIAMPIFATARGGERAVVDDHVGQAAGLQQLHHDPGPAAVGDHVVDLDHARVRQRGGRAGLAQRPLAEGVLLALRHGRREDHLLDRDVAAQQGVRGAPDRAHAAVADRRPAARTGRRRPCPAPPGRPSARLPRDDCSRHVGLCVVTAGSSPRGRTRAHAWRIGRGAMGCVAPGSVAVRRLRTSRARQTYLA